MRDFEDGQPLAQSPPSNKNKRGIMKLLKFSALILIIAMALTVAFHTSSKAKIILVKFLPTSESTVKQYGIPTRTDWQPNGAKTVSSNSNPNSRPVTFGRSLHTDVHGSDEISTVIAPMFKEDWTTEENMFLAEGPVFDSQGNIYFCPIMNPDDALIVSIEPKEGKRRWAQYGFNFGCGTPYILIDPDTGKDIIYLGTYDRAMALTTGGEIIWDVPTGLPTIDPKKIEAYKHSFGINYIAKYDALMASLGDGYIYLLDRKTGKQLLDKPYMLPGAKAKALSGSLPDSIITAAKHDAQHMFKETGEDDVLSHVLHIAAGENQKVSNYFSVDSNSGTIWIAATVPDEADGNIDGWSESAALYSLSIVEKNKSLSIEINTSTEVPGGTASTPTVSADGKRIYIANAFDTVYAVNATNGEIIWSQQVGDKVTGSLVVTADNNEVYANTKTTIVKLIDNGDSAQIAWNSKLDMFMPGLFQDNFNMLGAEVGANGIAFMASAGIMAGNLRLPFNVGAGFIDRESGEIKYFIEGADDSVSSTVTGPDGAIYNGNSPLRRVLARAILGKEKSPQKVRGGVTRFKPIHYELIIRDALLAASKRAKNASLIKDNYVVEQDILQIQQLLTQAEDAIPLSLQETFIEDDILKKIGFSISKIKKNISSQPESLREIAAKLDSLQRKIY